MNSSSNSGKYIIPFAVIVIVLNIFLIVFLFLNQSGVFKQEDEIVISEDDIYLSLPVSDPVSSPF